MLRGFLLISALFTAASVAAQAPPTTTGPPPLKVRGNVDPTGGLSPDLQKIVILCATDPESAELKRDWATYLHERYEDGMNVDAMIEDLITRADEYRRTTHTATGKLRMTASEKRTLRRELKSTARTVVKKKKQEG